MNLDSIVNNAVTLLIGAVTGGFLGALATGLVWWFDRRTQTIHTLLTEGLAVHALREAWILEGSSYETIKISNSRALISQQEAFNGLWLRQVEVRAVFDESRWNSPDDQYFAFLEGRRAWIVRDSILEQPHSYSTRTSGVQPHPALLSSQAMEEICGWIERAASAKRGWRLSTYGCRVLRTLLDPVAGEDRIGVFGERLTADARNFLEWYRKKYMMPK
ncbi:MAG: hypothetical protein ABI684_07550 [Nitrospirota bacterium]